MFVGLVDCVCARELGLGAAPSDPSASSPPSVLCPLLLLPPPRILRMSGKEIRATRSGGWRAAGGAVGGRAVEPLAGTRSFVFGGVGLGSRRSMSSKVADADPEGPGLAYSGNAVATAPRVVGGVIGVYPVPRPCPTLCRDPCTRPGRSVSAGLTEGDGLDDGIRHAQLLQMAPTHTSLTSRLRCAARLALRLQDVSCLRARAPTCSAHLV